MLSKTKFEYNKMQTNKQFEKNKTKQKNYYCIPKYPFQVSKKRKLNILSSNDFVLMSSRR
jgi:hypothetical protein